MEKAVLKTLVYADIFNYPLKAWEIHKWLIGKNRSLRQLGIILRRLVKKSRIDCKKDFYFLKGRQRVVDKRLTRQKSSNNFVKKARYLCFPLKLVPWIKLVGVSGGLAMDNAGNGDDIDLFVIVQNGRLWLARFFILIYLDFLGVRRKRSYKKNEVSGKFCVNLILEEDKLQQKNKDLFTAHEVLQMKPLWQRAGSYQRFLEENEWVFKFLPNWSSVNFKNFLVKKGNTAEEDNLLLATSEFLIRRIQLNIMRKPSGQERIEDGGLYFHPFDNRQRVLEEYNKRLTKYRV